MIKPLNGTSEVSDNSDDVDHQSPPTKPIRSKLRKLARGGIGASIVLLIGVVITVTILLTNDKDNTTSSSNESESLNDVENNNETASLSPINVNTTSNTTTVTDVPIAVPLSTWAPSIMNNTNNDTTIIDNDSNTTDVAPTPSIVPESNITTNATTTAPVAVSLPVAVPVSISVPVLTTIPSISPTYLNEPTTTIFYAHGDIPYETPQTAILEQQMKTVPLDAEFVIFVGDLRDAGDDKLCVQQEFDDASYYFRLSHAPVFVIQGDNDVADCPNVEEGRAMWYGEFVGFESKYWNHTFDIKRQDGYPDNFAFVHKYSLFMGLNIIGGDTRDATEWETRLSAEASWTIDLIRQYRTDYTNTTHIGRIVIFGHANPGARHATYFQTVASFINYELNNTIPIVYINGDKHEWMYTPNFYDQPSWLRIGVTGLGAEPLLRVTVAADGTYLAPEMAYEIERFIR